MSAIDLITALYFDIMNVDPARPDWPERDRFLLSAGHKAMGQYGVLAERGYFDPALLQTYGAMMVGYPKFAYHRLPTRKTPVIDWRL